MYQPNRAQWRVIWIGAAVAGVIWILGSNGPERLALVVLGFAALGVWRLAR